MQTYPTGYAQSHRMAEHIFRDILPRRGMAVREEQIALCHEILDTLYNKEISLCEAGVGIGNHNAKGEVCVCRNATEAAKKFKPGQILVVPFTTNDTLPFMREAAGIITEEAGTNSHSAIVGLTLDKAVIVGATNATRTLKDGMTISMDCARGVVQAMAK